MNESQRFAQSGPTSLDIDASFGQSERGSARSRGVNALELALDILAFVEGQPSAHDPCLSGRTIGELALGLIHFAISSRVVSINRFH